MAYRTFPVTAEWAMWGRDAAGPGYRLLQCSAGAIDRQSFEEVHARYSPGTLQILPQVTIGWFSDNKEDRNYVTLEIHDQQARSDAESHEIVLTRLFCVPFSDLAAGAISYLTMYEQFLKFRRPASSQDPMITQLPATPVSAPADGLAMRVAAMLLTSKPVCILGADRLDLTVRLEFLDAVASLLPYGLRSRLSASTWASSTFTGHKLRLFFASAERRAAGADYTVIWGRPDDTPIDHAYADDYLGRLRNGVLQPGQLAQDKNLMGFTQIDIHKMLERRAVIAEPPAAWQSIGHDAARIGADPAGDMGVEQLLRSCAYALNGDPDVLEAGIERLQLYLHDRVTGDERRRYAELLRKLRLLRPVPPMGEPLLVRFYNVLLRLAFVTPLSYQGYCEVEACSSPSEGQSLHGPLLRAMQQVGLKGPAQLLVVVAIGEKELKRTLRESPVAPADLLSIAANPRLLPQHAKIIFDIVARNLRDQSGHIDRQVLREALRRHGDLASKLQERFRGEPDYQLNLLSDILKAAYGSELGRAEIQDVLGGSFGAPTAALFAATLRLASPKDMQLVAAQFLHGLITSAELSDNTRRELDELLGSNLAINHDTEGSLTANLGHAYRRPARSYLIAGIFLGIVMSSIVYTFLAL